MFGIGATVTGFAGSWNWLFELTSHFKVQLAAALLVLTVLLCWGRRWRWAAWVGLACGLNGIAVGWAVRPSSPGAAPEAPAFRLLSLNVHTANTRSDLVRTAIREGNPDVIVLLEVNDRWIQELASLRNEYPAAVLEPREDNFGIALFSRLPLQRTEILELGDVPVPSIAVEIGWGGRVLRLLGTHPVPPGSPEYAGERNRQLAAIAEWARMQPGPVVVAGDLNATPWSPYFRALLDSGRLSSAQPDWGWYPTWPSGAWPLRIPLDHCLVSSEVAVRRRWVGEGVGSDHFPLWVDLAWRGPDPDGR